MEESGVDFCVAGNDLCFSDIICPENRKESGSCSYSMDREWHSAHAWRQLILVVHQIFQDCVHAPMKIGGRGGDTCELSVDSVF